MRICDGDATVDRAKIVRSDFLAPSADAEGNVIHWTRRTPVQNTVDPAALADWPGALAGGCEAAGR